MAVEQELAAQARERMLRLRVEPGEVMSMPRARRRLSEVSVLLNSGRPYEAKRRLTELTEDIDRAANVKALTGGNLGDALGRMRRSLKGVSSVGVGRENLVQCRRCLSYVERGRHITVQSERVCRPCAERRRCAQCLRAKTPERDCSNCAGRAGRSGWVIPTAFENNRNRH